MAEAVPKLTLALVQEACVQRLVETEQLDWKRDLPLPKGAGSNDQGVRERSLELAKDIAAMANSRGGMLVYGVREESNQAVEVVGVGDVSDGGSPCDARGYFHGQVTSGAMH